MRVWSHSCEEKELGVEEVAKVDAGLKEKLGLRCPLELCIQQLNVKRILRCSNQLTSLINTLL